MGWSKETKTRKVLEYLQTHPNGITSMEAITMFGATRLSAIVFNLRKRGFNITSEKEMGIDRYNNAVGFARYKLIPTDTEEQRDEQC